MGSSRNEDPRATVYRRYSAEAYELARRIRSSVAIGNVDQLTVEAVIASAMLIEKAAAEMRERAVRFGASKR